MSFFELVISLKSSDFQNALAPRCRAGETKICSKLIGPHGRPPILCTNFSNKYPSEDSNNDQLGQ